MKKFVLVLALVLSFAVGSAPAFAGSIALTGTLPPGGYPQATAPAPANNNIRMAQSIALTGQLPAVQQGGAGATAAIPANSINISGVLPAGAQGLTASSNGIGAGVAIMAGLGYLFTVKLLTLHF